MKAKIKSKISYEDLYWDEYWDNYWDNYYGDEIDWWWYETNLTYIPGTTIIDIMPLYSKERLRDKKLDILFGNSNKQTLGDFWLKK